MLSASAPTPPPHPPPVRTDSRLVEPDEQWKADLRRRIEFGLRNMVEDAQNVRDMILSFQPSESSRERAQREYEESMTAIRNLAQEEFNRELRMEMSERKWALDVTDSNSPDVARLQQWIIDNIRKADDDRPSFVNPDSPKNAEGVLSASPQEQIDSERASDDDTEAGYMSGRPGDEGSGSDQSMESEEGEGDVQPRQSRPNASLTQPYSPGRHWNRVARPSEPSGISRTFTHTNEQTYRPSPAKFPRRGVNNTGSNSSSTGLHRAGSPQMYTPNPVQFPRRGSVGSTGSNSSDTGLRRAGSLNSDQHHNSSVAPHNPHNGTERPPTQARDRIASNIGPHDRQMSASASPHDRPSPPTYPTVAPRAIPGAHPPPIDDTVRSPTFAGPGSRVLFSMQRSPEDTRRASRFHADLRPRLTVRGGPRLLTHIVLTAVSMYTGGTTTRMVYASYRSTETFLMHPMRSSTSSMTGGMYVACEACAVCGAWN